jgi:hypothetical protein
MPRTKSTGFFQQHSLSLIVAGILLAWLVAYLYSDPATHLGSFFGNAVADWTGTLVFIVATKYFFEIGSRESRRPHSRIHVRVGRFLVRHSLTIVIAVTGVCWAVAYSQSDVDGKAGQVIGNLVSEWTQILGLVIITKYAREVGSKEGN